jgi:three-Cys-motif partner protein
VTKSRDFFDEFPPHSKHKLLILKTYFEAWGRKLLLRRNAGSIVCYVDACAGPGMDDEGNYGSPIVAAKAAAMAMSQLNERRSGFFQIEVIAIEKRPTKYKALAKNLQPYGDHARALRGTLADHLPAIEEEFGDTPTLYFIDPFGVEPLHADVIRRALARPKNEAFLLFKDQAALRHFGAAATNETRMERRVRRRLEELDTPSLFPEWAEAERAELEPIAARSREALEITRERAIEILTAAFGGTQWLPELEATPPEFKRNRLVALYRALLAEWGARYVLEIPVLKEDGSHVYFLLHASKSPKGYRTMKEAVEYALKRSPLPADATAAMWDLLRTDVEEVERLVREEFAGREVAWAESDEDRRAPSLRAFVLETTAIYPFELNDLRKRLKEAQQPSRKIVYRFPKASRPV